MQAVKMYTTAVCPYCIRAKQLLNARGVSEIEEIRVDLLADERSRMMALTGRLARENGSPDGYRTIVNTGRIGRQDVMHDHVHVLGGTNPLGPMVPRH